MPNPYNLSLTAAQIDAALLAASPTATDQTPAALATNLVNSNKIHEFVTGHVATEVSTLESVDTALDGRVTSLEGAVNYGNYKGALVVPAINPLNRTNTGILDFIENNGQGSDGYIEQDYSLGITETGSQLTIPAGTWFMEYAFSVTHGGSDGSPAQVTSLRIDGVAVDSYTGNNPRFNGGLFVTKGSSWTLDIYWTEGDSALTFANSLVSGSPIFNLKKLS